MGQETLEAQSNIEQPVDLLILAAGYATRLYPLTLNQPKPLLKVGGQPMIDHVLRALSPIPTVHNVYVVTNAKFAQVFEEWARETRGRYPNWDFQILNDGSTDDSNKLGAIGDLHFVLQTAKPAHDLIVVAGDNLFSQTLEGFAAFAQERKAVAVGVYDVGSLELAKKYNEIRLNDQGQIVYFEEKPSSPTSTLCAIALYYYPQAMHSWVDRYIAEGNNPDQPGRLIQWLYTRMPVYAWQVPGIWYDIGSKESLQEADRAFSQALSPESVDSA